MRKLVGIGTLGLSLAAALMGLTACAENEETIIITNAIPPADDCIFMTGQDVVLSSLTWDASFDPPEALVGLEVLNNLTDRDPGDSNNQINDSEIQIMEAIVELSGPGGSSEFTVPLAQNSFTGEDRSAALIKIPAEELLAAAGGSPGFLEEVPVDMITTIRGFRASNFGLANGGLEETRPFRLPVYVCNSCLRRCVVTETTDMDNNQISLCTPDQCANNPQLAGGECGLPQGGDVFPLCCDGMATLAQCAP